MGIKVCQISVRDLIEWLCQQVGQIGQGQWDLLDMATKSQNQGMLGNQNDSLAWGVLQLLHHFA